MGRLIVVSNRVAAVTDKKAATGGLAVAVMAALHDVGGMWFGWSGEISSSESEAAKVFDVGKLTYATVDLTAHDHEQYYNGFANSTLWPILHSQLDRMAYSRHDFSGYMRVNTYFVNHLLKLIRPDDTLWIHDYHLIPVAELLRQAGFNGRIAFFLHTPFPPLELLLALPCHHEIVRGFCTFDLVGFQTSRDLRAFHDYVQYEADGTVGADGMVRAYGRDVKACAFPIGIDTQAFTEVAETASRSTAMGRLRRSMTGETLIIGTDRLDYSKGLSNRFAAFDRLLTLYPENRRRATLMQVAPLSREELAEYAEIRSELEELSGRINGRFAEFDWVPIRYLNRSIQHRTLAGFMRHARVGLVTPLRDGMNLVAKEYIAAQDPDDPGVLVLSRFAGAAEELREAVIVNPYDIDGVAEGLQLALTMPLDERKARWQALYDTISRNNVHHWRDSFLGTLQSIKAAA